MSDGTTYEIDIPVRAMNVKSAAEQVLQLGQRLDLAKEMAEKAARAVADGSAAYKTAQNAAAAADRAVGRLGDQAAVLRQRMQDAMTSGNEAAFWRTARAADELAKKQAIAAARAREARDAVTTQAAALSRLRAASASAATAQEKIGKALEDATKNHKKLEDAAAKEKGTGNLGKMSSALGSLGGPVGSLGSRAAGLADAFGNLKGAMGASTAVAAGAAIAIAALVAVVVALGAATLVGAVNLGRWSIGLSDAARSSSLLSAGIARTVAGGKQLDATIASLQDRVPLARDELVSMASDLAKTGLRGDALSAALENAAVKAAKLKLGPEFEKELLSIQSQSSRLDRHLSKLFKLDIEPLLQGFSKLVALFDPMSVTGKAIQTVYQDIASRVLNRIVDFIPKIVAGFIQVQIWVLKALIAIKPFGPTILEIGKFFLTMGAVALGVVGFIVAQVMLAVASVLALQAGIALLGKMIVDKLVGAINKLRSMSLEDIGRALLEGLGKGIMAGLSYPIDAITSVADATIGAAKRALGIKSPSRVMAAEIGAPMAEGVGVGFDSASGEIADAVEGGTDPASFAAGGGASSSTSATNNFYITVEGGGDAQNLAERIRDELASLLSGDTSQLATG